LQQRERDGEAGRYSAFDARYRANGVGRVARDALPVIDLAPFVAGGLAADRARTAAELRAACIDIGFFCVVGHGIPQDELDAALDWGRRFFALPVEDKMRIHGAKGPGRLGYAPAGGLGPAASANRAADLKERLSLGRDLEPGEPAVGTFGAGQSQWPEGLPGFAPFMRAHIAHRTALARHLARAFALSLDLPEGYFDPMFRHLGCVLMMNWYPPLPRAEHDDNRWSFSPHTDYGAFTLLLQDARGGLEVRNAAGDWIEATPVPGAFVVNIGDLFAMWTNDLYMSSLHRVIHFGPEPRQSMALFTYPHGRTEIRCLPTCHDAAHPPRYPPVIAEEYDRMLVEQASRTGRPGISARTAERLAEY
jgi:isopenicillin N synthase-like dioxygenase